MMSTAITALALALAVLTLGFCIVAYLWWRVRERLSTIEVSHKEALEARGEKSVTTSKNKIHGRIAQHLAPYFPDYPYNFEDTYLGPDPLDLIVLRGLRSESELKEIIFVEVKTGSRAASFKPSLSRTQRDLRKVVREHRVRFEVYSPGNRPTHLGLVQLNKPDSVKGK